LFPEVPLGVLKFTRLGLVLIDWGLFYYSASLALADASLLWDYSFWTLFITFISESFLGVLSFVPYNEIFRDMTSRCFTIALPLNLLSTIVYWGFYFTYPADPSANYYQVVLLAMISHGFPLMLQTVEYWMDSIEFSFEKEGMV
jgi:hypothetical protein